MSGYDRPITSIYIPKEFIGEKTNQNMIQVIKKGASLSLKKD
jgi:hypothetical protein